MELQQSIIITQEPYEVLDRLKELKKNEKFSIIDVYLAAAQTQKIVAYPHDDDIWLDVGKLDAIEEAERIMKKINS